MSALRRWGPAGIFVLGILLTLGIERQKHLELRGDLAAAIPARLLGLNSQDLILAEGEVDVAGMDAYLLRSYSADAGSAAPASTGGAPGGAGKGAEETKGPVAAEASGLRDFSLYVGFYGSQAQGRTIHSPKNCLPGSGWEALQSRETTVETPAGPIPVNRYLLQRDSERALVLYWYQGRQRVRANEYLVKLDLLKDSALRGRSDEALVRIVVPIQGSEEEAFATAARIAAEIVPVVDTVLPA